MKLKEDMIVRLKNKVGKHKKDSVIRILYIIGTTAFCENIISGEKLVISRESNEVEDLNEGVFHV